MSVNNVSVSNVSHADAVEALKSAGERVKLLVKRRRPHPSVKTIAEIDLVKIGDKGLGFSIAGGIGNQHIPGDDGIYVTKIMEGGISDKDGRLSIGDKLLNVKTGQFNKNLENVTHEDAVATLKAINGQVYLTVQKSQQTVTPVTPNQNQSQPELNLTNKSENSQPDGRSPSPIKFPTSPKAVSCEDIAREPRTIILQKGSSGLGFNIVGGEDGQVGIFVSFILAGGVADLSRELKRGDQLLSVNGIDLMNASHEEAAQTVKNAPLGQVTLVAQYRPEEYNRFEARIHELKSQASKRLRTSQKHSLYVRTLFDYDPNKDDALPTRGLSFKYGDILHVINASDDEWWQAKKVVGDHEEENIIGIVPSKKRWERKQKASSRSVKFQEYQPPPSRSSSTEKVEISSLISEFLRFITIFFLQMSTLDRKKKKFSFSKPFQFMKSREDGLNQERELCE